MNKPVFYIILFLCFVGRTQQNLVYNGDFEEYSSCPLGVSTPFQNPKEIEKCVGWKAPTYGTSDYFNTCSLGVEVSVPSNILGTQFPFSGDGYLGCLMVSYTGGSGDDGYNGIEWWEYVQGELTNSLEQGKIYKLSIEVSLAESSDLFINELGVYFSDEPVSSQNTAALNYSPQCVFVANNYFKDTVNWMYLETYFQVDGGEKYLTIGNFRNNVDTDTLRRYWVDPPYNYSYMYLDNVVVTENTDDFALANIFTPNGDGVNDLWEPLLSGSENQRVTILNRWGNVIKDDKLNGFSWDGMTPNGEPYSEGTYFYTISETNLAGFIQLVR